jgi:hypothetical protein
MKQPPHGNLPAMWLSIKKIAAQTISNPNRLRRVWINLKIKTASRCNSSFESDDDARVFIQRNGLAAVNFDTREVLFAPEFFAVRVAAIFFELRWEV